MARAAKRAIRTERRAERMVVGRWQECSKVVGRAVARGSGSRREFLEGARWLRCCVLSCAEG